MSNAGDESVIGNRLEATDTMECGVQRQQGKAMGSASEQSMIPDQQLRPLSTFERVFTTHAPILESLLLQIPTDTLLKLYRTSYYLRNFLRSYPTAWKYLSFRLFYPCGVQPTAGGGLHVIVPPDISRDLVPISRRPQPYALDQLLMCVVAPFSPCLTSLELDNTTVSGQILISTVLYSRRETLEHLSVRGCKNVSLKYHIIPYLTMFGLQYDVDMLRNAGSSPSTKRLALKSLYAYRCRHHRRRPYLSSSLMRKDSDSEPTHELVNLCHKLGIWTDTAWCTTPAGRCLRRRGYVSMKVPQGFPEVWVVFDRLWRSKNFIGPVHETREPPTRNGKLWEHDETGCYGEPLGTGEGREFGEGKMKPAHLRRSHRQFVENIRCDNCCDEILERCEQCSILMHCIGCRKTLCASCAFERPYPRLQLESSTSTESQAQNLWWAPGAPISPCLMQDPPGVIPTGNNNINDPFNLTPTPRYPGIKFRWCCTEPIFSGGGAINVGAPGRNVDIIRAVPLPKGQGWEDKEYSESEWSRTFPKYAYGDPSKPDYSLETGHIAMMKWLFGSPSRQVVQCPRNLCQECYDSPQWKVHCKCCSNPLCIEHDLRGLRLRICGYRDLALEKLAIQSRSGLGSQQPAASLVTSSSAVGFRLPYRQQRTADSTTSSFSGGHPADDSDDLDNPVLDDSSETAIPCTNRVSRNLSATDSVYSRSSSPSSVDFTSFTETPKWQGCQSFFCPQYRAVGDHRQCCPRVLRECTSCSVNVCQDCISINPPCNCSYCRVNYRCPNCRKALENDGACRKTEEDERKRREKQWKKDREALEKILERKKADEVAGFAHQFFDYLHSQVPVEEEEQQQRQATMDLTDNVELDVAGSFDDILNPFSLGADERVGGTEPAIENDEQPSHAGVDDDLSEFNGLEEDISD